MKKKQINLKQLALKKSSVASLAADGLKGGTNYQSWTGTAEPCLSEFECQTDDCATNNGCPPPHTQNCPTNGCPPRTNDGCDQTALYSFCNGMQCY